MGYAGKVLGGRGKRRWYESPGHILSKDLKNNQEGIKEKRDCGESQLKHVSYK